MYFNWYLMTAFIYVETCSMIEMKYWQSCCCDWQFSACRIHNLWPEGPNGLVATTILHNLHKLLMVWDTWDTVSGGWTRKDTCTLLNGECGTSSTDIRHMGISIPSWSTLCGNGHGSNCVLTLTVTLTSRSAAVLASDTPVHTHITVAMKQSKTQKQRQAYTATINWT
jgi:hypothetical protein